MDSILIRDMIKEDYIDIKNNILTELSLDKLKQKVLNNVLNMKYSNNKYLVALLDNKVAGITYLICNDDPSFNHVANIESVFIGKEYRGRGIFKQMFNYIIEYSKLNGIEKLVISVKKDCPQELVCKNMGFKMIGELGYGYKGINNEYTNSVYYYFDIV